MNQLDHLKEPSTSESSDDGSGSPTAGSQNQWKYTCPLGGCDFNPIMYGWRHLGSYELRRNDRAQLFLSRMERRTVKAFTEQNIEEQ